MIELLPPPPTEVAPTPTEAVIAFLQSEGNVYLAAERLHLTKSTYLQILAQDPQSLQNAMRVNLLISVARTISNLETTLLSSIADLEPKEAVKAYALLAQTLTTLTAPSQSPSPLSLNQQFNFNLSDQVRQALSILSNDQ